MAACWRSLHELSGIEVFVIAFQARTETAFPDRIMQGVPCRLLSLEEREDPDLVKSLVLAESPNVVVLCGWFHKPYRQLAFTSELRQVAFVMGMDTPWWGTWKQRLAPCVLNRYLRRMQRVVVTGERSWQYASRLGVPQMAIARGLYGVDYTLWETLWDMRRQSSWPRSFLFVGRYVQAKGIDILVEAYRLYRSWVSDPWSLVCCGQGPLANLLTGQSGIDDQGFIPPADLMAVWLAAGAFILPSRFDPWPLALVEASASGLPVVCTDACGSAVELIRHGYNGSIVPQGNPEALARSLLTVHECHDRLPTWGKRAQQLAAPYAADVWADRWRDIVTDLKQTESR